MLRGKKSTQDHRMVLLKMEDEFTRNRMQLDAYIEPRSASKVHQLLFNACFLECLFVQCGLLFHLSLNLVIVCCNSTFPIVISSASFFLLVSPLSCCLFGIVLCVKRCLESLFSSIIIIIVILLIHALNRYFIVGIIIIIIITVEIIIIIIFFFFKLFSIVSLRITPVTGNESISNILALIFIRPLPYLRVWQFIIIIEIFFLNILLLFDFEEVIILALIGVIIFLIIIIVVIFVAFVSCCTMMLFFWIETTHSSVVIVTIHQ
mmetsp:Transcript_7575/g.12005  ORF Transcript_7575/g.12005 Transcript_7575/m.12005 type:complete len:263 (-) Transcript_7575:226-1014(-)